MSQLNLAALEAKQTSLQKKPKIRKSHPRVKRRLRGQGGCNYTASRPRAPSGSQPFGIAIGDAEQVGIEHAKTQGYGTSYAELPFQDERCVVSAS